MTRTAICGATLIDGTGADPVPDSLILMNGTKIERIGTLAELDQLPAETVRLDATGRWIIPGLINCHEHIVSKSLVGMPREQARYKRIQLYTASDLYLILEAAHNVLFELGQGVTTLRDLGSRHHINIHLRNAIDNGLLVGPRILACGEAVTMTGGHIYDVSREADGPDEVRKAVREQLRAGADCIKVMASGGLNDWPREAPGEVEYTVEELQAAVEEAHKRGRRVAAHAHADEAVRNAIKAGIDSVEHGFFMQPETAKIMASQGTHYVPTLGVPTRGFPRNAEVNDGGFTAFLDREVVPVHRRAFQAAADAGVLIAAATDGPCYIYDELEMMVEYGFTPREAILAATRSASIVVDRAHDRGTLEPGKLADLVVLDRDPHQDITAIRQIRAVVKDGTVVTGALPAAAAARLLTA